MKANIKTPLIGLSLGDDEMSWSEYRAAFLEQGGDDLLKLPGSPRELTATLRACTRRATGTQLDVIECTRNGVVLKINLTALLVTVNGNAVRLTGKEFVLLSILARAKGRHVTKETLLSRMYVDGVEEVPELKIIDVFICKLRKKLADTHPDREQFIETLWGQGYQLMSSS